jgi:hypothetical protein
MSMRLPAVLCAAFLCVAGRAADPALDTVKYPQDTPEKALDSLAKALEANDLGYWMLYIGTPDHLQRMLDKYKTVDAAVAAIANEPQRVAGRKMLAEFIRQLQAGKTAPAAAPDDPKIVQFVGANAHAVQFEQQPDKRWCFNPKPAPRSAPASITPGTTPAPK